MSVCSSHLPVCTCICYIHRYFLQVVSIFVRSPVQVRSCVQSSVRSRVGPSASSRSLFVKNTSFVLLRQSGRMLKREGVRKRVGRRKKGGRGREKKMEGKGGEREGKKREKGRREAEEEEGGGVDRGNRRRKEGGGERRERGREGKRRGKEGGGGRGRRGRRVLLLLTNGHDC